MVICHRKKVKVTVLIVSFWFIHLYSSKLSVVMSQSEGEGHSVLILSFCFIHLNSSKLSVVIIYMSQSEGEGHSVLIVFLFYSFIFIKVVSGYNIYVAVRR